jgi:exodeoxyribonuclease VII large subunit
MKESHLPFEASIEDRKQSDKPSEYTVSELSNIIKRTIEKDLGLVRVRGEVSGLKVAPSGHAYFSLKDDNAVLAAICWRGQYMAMQQKPQEGLEIVCIGELTTYSMQSKYQIIVQSLKASGLGALMALLEKRKNQFQKEGLFDAVHKKPLPFLPATIGIVTSLAGAVIQDIIHRITDRFPVRVLIWPVLVQGDKSAQQIAAAIKGFNEDQLRTESGEAAPRPDVLIVARGGGPIEDLWSFNEEIVVRAAFASQIPIISAVGHETDTTLLDYVADVRAPTPTAAAEIAVPLKRDLVFTLDELHKRQRIACLNYLSNKQTAIHSTRNAGIILDMLLVNYTQRVDALTFRLLESLARYFDTLQLKLDNFKERLSTDVTRINLTRLEDHAKELGFRLFRGFDSILTKNFYTISCIAQLLASLDYKNVLKRGFALVRDQDRTVLKSIEEISSEIVIEMHNGEQRFHVAKIY